MKSRMNIVVVMLLAILAGLIWGVLKNQRSLIKASAAAATPSMETPAAKVEILIVPATQPVSPALQVAPHHPAAEVAHTDEQGATRHIAKPGETVTSLATDLLGKDTKTNRDAIINANASLKANPDRLLAGNAYRIPPATEVPATQTAPAIAVQATPKVQPEVIETVHVRPETELKYTARPGDTVAKMAQAFLGGDDKINQDAIVAANPSLQADPDRLAAGKTYRIPAPGGLSAAAVRTSPAISQPTTQPDADQVVLASSTRKLRYTARAGDTVTTLAIELLGSDTQETRDAIISNNPELKLNPDRVIAGQTYWIPAPKAAVRNP